MQTGFHMAWVYLFRPPAVACDEGRSDAGRRQNPSEISCAKTCRSGPELLLIPDHVLNKRRNQTVFRVFARLELIRVRLHGLRRTVRHRATTNFRGGSRRGSGWINLCDCRNHHGEEQYSELTNRTLHSRKNQKTSYSLEGSGVGSADSDCGHNLRGCSSVLPGATDSEYLLRDNHHIPRLHRRTLRASAKKAARTSSH